MTQFRGGAHALLLREADSYSVSAGIHRDTIRQCVSKYGAERLRCYEKAVLRRVIGGNLALLFAYWRTKERL